MTEVSYPSIRFQAAGNVCPNIFMYAYLESLSLSRICQKNYNVVIKNPGAWGCWGGVNLPEVQLSVITGKCHIFFVYLKGSNSVDTGDI